VCVFACLCPCVLQTYGVAFAQAIASGGEEGEALAQATAIAFCQGGGTATAFARAYSVALSKDKNGCNVLTQARTIAVAKCSGGVFTSFTEATVESRVLGLCGIRKEFGKEFGQFPSFGQLPSFGQRPSFGGIDFRG
jgi:hypothetical protein